ncbi:MAG: antibiotic biosynthesis monooxygenase, partial [Prevotella sp.]|nr:antibiotic biosynthesis monooxygenase [Prevotella sp.]
RPLVMMFCETWKDEEVLKAHIASAHFTDLVPKIEALTKNGLKLEKFEF